MDARWQGSTWGHPTRDGMQVMLNTCQKFATKFNLRFSTDPNPEKSKTKCIFVCGKSKVQKPAPLVLDFEQVALGGVSNAPWKLHS